MAHIKYFVLTGLLSVLLSAGTVIGVGALSAKAEASSEQEIEMELINATTGGEVEPYGLFTNLTLSMDGENGEVWAKVKNTFTLFPATVYVYVELYSSFTYQDSYLNMQLMSKNYTKDLDMNNSIEARASTNGEQKYWKARMYFKIDKDDWKDRMTDTYLLDKNGLLVM